MTKNGFILLNKPAGITSFKVLGTVKSALKIKKVGHIGTLDRFAGGLVGVLTGCYTKLVPYFTGMDKEYLAEITFGRRTDTLDPEGATIEEKEIPDIVKVKEVLKNYTGVIEQVPPLYSAVHYNGERAYKLVRNGEKPELKPRKVTVYSIEFLAWEPPVLNLKIKCSKGTYIRALARDIGKDCNSCAYLSALKRTSIGPFSIKDSVKPEDFNPVQDIIMPYNLIKHLDDFIVCRVKENKVNKVLTGCVIKDDYFIEYSENDGEIAVFDSFNRLIAIVLRKNGEYSYNTVFNLTGNS